MRHMVYSINHAPRNLSIKHIHFHSYPAVYAKGGSAHEFFNTVPVLDAVNGFVEVDRFGCVVKQIDLMIALNQVA
jgi:hypothetical protein